MRGEVLHTETTFDRQGEIRASRKPSDRLTWTFDNLKGSDENFGKAEEHIEHFADIQKVADKSPLQIVLDDPFLLKDIKAEMESRIKECLVSKKQSNPSPPDTESDSPITGSTTDADGNFHFHLSPDEMDKDYVAVPGRTIFADGTFDWKHIGPKKSRKVRAWTKRILSWLRALIKTITNDED